MRRRTGFARRIRFAGKVLTIAAFGVKLRGL